MGWQEVSLQVPTGGCSTSTCRDDALYIHKDFCIKQKPQPLQKLCPQHTSLPSSTGKPEAWAVKSSWWGLTHWKWKIPQENACDLPPSQPTRRPAAGEDLGLTISTFHSGRLSRCSNKEFLGKISETEGLFSHPHTVKINSSWKFKIINAIILPLTLQKKNFPQKWMFSIYREGGGKNRKNLSLVCFSMAQNCPNIRN